MLTAMGMAEDYRDPTTPAVSGPAPTPEVSSPARSAIGSTSPLGTAPSFLLNPNLRPQSNLEDLSKVDCDMYGGGFKAVDRALQEAGFAPRGASHLAQAGTTIPAAGGPVSDSNSSYEKLYRAFQEENGARLSNVCRSPNRGTPAQREALKRSFALTLYRGAETGEISRDELAVTMLAITGLAEAPPNHDAELAAVMKVHHNRAVSKTHRRDHINGTCPASAEDYECPGRSTWLTGVLRRENIDLKTAARVLPPEFYEAFATEQFSPWRSADHHIATNILCRDPSSPPVRNAFQVAQWVYEDKIEFSADLKNPQTRHFIAPYANADWQRSDRKITPQVISFPDNRGIRPLAHHFYTRIAI